MNAIGGDSIGFINIYHNKYERINKKKYCDYLKTDFYSARSFEKAQNRQFVRNFLLIDYRFS